MPVVRCWLGRLLLPAVTVGAVLIGAGTPASGQTPCTSGPGGVSGTPDCNFGGTGLVTTSLPAVFGTGTRVVAQPDGKLVVVGYGYPANRPQGGGYDWYVLRYNANGTLDPTFGSSGIATAGVTASLDSERSYGVTLQSVSGETRIVVVGSAPLKSTGNPQFGVAAMRFTSTGLVDTSFGTGGRTQFSWSGKDDSFAYDVTLQCDGRILIAGKYGSDMAIARLTASGLLDSTFGSGGRTIVSLGKAAGGDTTGGGFAVTVQPFGAIQPGGCPADERVIVAGSRPTVNGSPTSRDMAVARLLRTGALDTSFGIGGKTFIDNAGLVDYAWGAVIDAQNRVVVTGYANAGPGTTPLDLAAARLTVNGQLDSTFGVGGRVTADIPDMFTFSESGAVIDEAGRILTSGVTHNSDGSVTDFVIVRFNPDGTPDSTFGTGGLAQIDFGVGTAEENFGRLTRDPAGRIVVVGSTDSSKRVAITVVNP